MLKIVLLTAGIFLMNIVTTGQVKATAEVSALIVSPIGFKTKQLVGQLKQPVIDTIGIFLNQQASTASDKRKRFFLPVIKEQVTFAIVSHLSPSLVFGVTLPQGVQLTDVKKLDAVLARDFMYEPFGSANGRGATEFNFSATIIAQPNQQQGSYVAREVEIILHYN